jgi:hypothetical protein
MLLQIQAYWRTAKLRGLGRRLGFAEERS